MPGHATGLAVPFSTPPVELPKSAGLSTCVLEGALLWVSHYARAPNSFWFISCLMPTTPNETPNPQMHGCKACF